MISFLDKVLSKNSLLYRYGDIQSLVERKLNSFKKYQNGWHYGEGLAFSSETIEKAREVYQKLAKDISASYDVFHGLNGEIDLILCSGRHYFEITISKDLSLLLSYEKEDEFVYTEKNVTDCNIASKIKEALRISLCESSESSKLVSTTKTENDSKAQHLETQVMERGFLLSQEHASIVHPRPLVNIFGTSIPEYTKSLRYASNSIQIV